MANLFDLAAKVTADMSQSDRALDTNQKKVLKLVDDYNKLQAANKKLEKFMSDTGGGAGSLGKAFQGLTSATTTLQGPMGGVASRLSSFNTLVGAMESPLAAIGVGIGALAAVTAGLALSFFELAKSTSEARGALFDMSQQTGVSVETLSALEIVAATTGSSLDQISASLGIFQKNIEAAQDSTSKQAATFKELGITSGTTEEALRRTLTALNKMPEGFHQTATALELFGRGGKSILAILKETSGDLDGAMAKFKAMGILVSTESAKSADEFNDAMAVAGFQLRAIGAQLTHDSIPIFKNFFEKIGGSLSDNQSTWEGWGRTIADVLIGIQAVVESRAAQIVVTLSNAFNPFIELLRVLESYGASHRGPTTSPYYGAMTGPYTPGTPEYAADDERLANMLFLPAKSAKKWGGAEKAKAKAAAKVSPGQQLLNQLTDEYNRLLEKNNNLTKFQAIQTELLKSKYATLSPALRELIEEQATYITMEEQAATTKKKGADAVKLIDALIEKQTESITEARNKGDEWDLQIKKLTADLIKAGEGIDAKRLATIKSNDVTLKAIALDKAHAEWLEKFRSGEFDYGAIMPDFDPNDIPSDRDYDPSKKPSALERIIGALPEPPSDAPLRKLVEFREQMRHLASDLTNVIDRALTDGFEHGMKAGLISFAQGILDIIKSAALDALEARLAEIFTNGLGGGGGGGLFEKIFGALLGIGAGAAGGAGGGGGGTGGVPIMFPHAQGLNYVPYDNYPALLHKGERVMTAADNKGGNGHTFIVNINVPDIQSAGSRATQYQVARQMQGHLAKAALTG